MSNARKPRKPAAAVRPDPPYLIPYPETLSFAELFRIHAATGVDVLDPRTRGHAVAAVLWFAARSWDNPLTWEEAQGFNLDAVEFVREDEALPDDDEEDEEEPDPTGSGGHATPSSASSSD